MSMVATQMEARSLKHDRPRLRPLVLGAVLLASIMMLPAVSGLPSGDCDEKDKNVECNAFGTIKMDSQRNMQGKSEIIDIETTIHQTYESSGARWIMFSIRHDSAGTESPITIELLEMRSAHGEIFASRIDHDVKNEINVWVHVVDIPEGEPVTMRVKVDSAEKGAYRIESLVMPFDRGYEPLRAGNEDVAMYSFTLLGVNGATGSGGGGLGGGNLRTPGPAILPAIAAIGLAAILVARRTKA